jgi:hypothetical protein
MCGDGRVSGGEACDPTAVPTGCAADATCVGCGFCQTNCGNGVVDTGEVCDPQAPVTCDPGSTCTLACDGCIPMMSTTEDLTPCFPAVFDRWTTQVAAGEDLIMWADTTDAGTAADLCVEVACDNGQGGYGDDNVPCTFPPPSFSCPLVSFTANSNTTCSVVVKTCAGQCADSSTARYRLDMTGAGATLDLDDAPASPSGGYVYSLGAA